MPKRGALPGEEGIHPKAIRRENNTFYRKDLARLTGLGQALGNQFQVIQGIDLQSAIAFRVIPFIWSTAFIVWHVFPGNLPAGKALSH